MLGKDIREYGEENFKLEVLETCQTLDELDRREIFWIAKLNCKFPNGYNRTDGGHFPKKAKNLGKGWLALYTDVAEWLAIQRLTGEQYSVMLFLFGKLDFDNYLSVGLQDIADKTGIKLPNISRAMRKLKELNIIIEGPVSGKFKSYRLNPYVAHKGSERKNTIVDFEKLLAEKSEKSESDTEKE